MKKKKKKSSKGGRKRGREGERERGREGGREGGRKGGRGQRFEMSKYMLQTIALSLYSHHSICHCHTWLLPCVARIPLTPQVVHCKKC